MCWVMPPASPAATSVSRIASSSDVLPWSTWPMIVTTGGRAARAPRRRPRTRARRPPRRRRGRSRSSCRTRRRAPGSASSVSVWVSVAISPSCISFLMTSGIGDAEVLGDVLDRRAGVDLDDVGLQDADVLRHGLRVGAAPAPAAAPRRAPLGAAAGTAARAAAGTAGAALAARGLRVDDDAAHAAGRAGRALALQRGAGGPARAVVATVAAATAVAACGGLLLAAGRLRLGLGLRLRLHALGRAGAEVADAEIAGRAQLRARRLLRLGAVRLRHLLAGQRRVGQRSRPPPMPPPSPRCRRRSAASSPRRWACCIAWLARGRASWPCVNEVYGLLRDGHRALGGPG